MQRLEVSGAVRLIYKSLGVKRLISSLQTVLSDRFISCTQIRHAVLLRGSTKDDRAAGRDVKYRIPVISDMLIGS